MQILSQQRFFGNPREMSDAAISKGNLRTTFQQSRDIVGKLVKTLPASGNEVAGLIESFGHGKFQVLYQR